MKAVSYLVTGGTGCIGAWVVRNLIRQGEIAVVLDRGGDHHRLELILDEAEYSKVIFIRGDITDLEKLHQIIAEHEIQHLIHLAALQLPFCRADPTKGARINVVGTINIFEAARQANLDKVVYASSAAVYGPKQNYPPGPLAHNAPLDPGSHYGVYKHANELNAKVYFDENSFSSIGLRPYVVYGPGRDQGMTSTPTKAMLAAVINTPYKISFGGNFSFQYVDDVAKVFIQACQAQFSGANVFNIGGYAPSADEIIEKIEAAKPEIRGKIIAETNTLPFPDEYENRCLKDVICDFNETELEMGVENTIRIYDEALASGRLSVEAAKHILGN